MKPDLSPTQSAIVARLRATPAGRLVRLPGGFWVVADGVELARGIPQTLRQIPARGTWVGTQTVAALVRLGVLSGPSNPRQSRGPFALAEAWR